MDKFKRKSIEHLVQKGLDDRMNQKVIAIYAQCVDISKINISKYFGKNVKITEDEETKMSTVKQEITVKDLIEYINCLNEEIKSRIDAKDKHYYNSTWWDESHKLPNKSTLKENPLVLQKPIPIPEKQTDLNVFNMLDLND